MAVRINVTLPPELAQELEELRRELASRHERLNVSAIVADAIRRAIDSRKQKTARA